MRKLVTVLLCIGVVISWQLCQNDSAIAGGKGHNCSLAGVWSAGNSFATVVPLDPAGRRFAHFSADPQPEDATVYGVFENAAAITPMRGILEKVDRNLFVLTLSQNIVDAAGDKIGMVEVSGETKLIDCDNRVFSSSIKVTDADGEILYCFPSAGQSERYKLTPPCIDLLPFPEGSE